MMVSSIMSVIGPSVGVALIGFVFAMPHLPTPHSAAFIETRLCASGITLRIEIPGQKQPEKEAPMPCHAVCARGHDGLDGNSDTDPEEDDA